MRCERPTLLLTLLPLMIIAVACSGGSDPLVTNPDPPNTDQPTQIAASPTPEATPLPVERSVWGPESVFEPTTAGPDVWEQACGVPLPALPPGSIDCTETVMRQLGADQSAIDFLRQHGYLLSSFEEQGRIDYGRGSAPWFNMSRPTQQLFLNGDPAVIEVGAIPDHWQSEPSYVPVVANDPTLFPWTEYGQIVAQDEAGGVLTFEIAYPLRDCRACQNIGFVVMAYDFDAEGHLTAERLLPFRD